MKTLITTLVIIALSASVVCAQTIIPKKVITPIRADKSSALRDMAKLSIPTKKQNATVEIPLKVSPLKDRIKNSNAKSISRDPAWQQSQGVLGTIPGQNFEGINEDDNENLIGFKVVPPDPNGDVGPNHYVQMVNILFAIYDKTGNPLLGPLPNNALWAGFGGGCEFDNDGDPVVLYDPIADRWVLTQFSVTSGFSICMACSATPDPTGAYYRYEFPFDEFPDYPKFGVWPDAYYATFRMFGQDFDMVAGAIEREKIIAGDPSAQIVLFSISDALAPTIIDGVLPIDLDGPPPPAGTPGIFLGLQDDAFTGAPEDRLVMFELDVDWDAPSSSTFSGPTFLPTEPFDTDIFGVPQPAPGGILDAIPGFMMHRLAYRNFGTHMSIVANHTVDVGDFDDHAGIRWYELRNESSGWNIYQQGTYAPNSDHRWMGSIAMDGTGNIALGYSTSGNFTFPSIRYTGRTPGAPLGQMNVVEQSIMEGGGSQLGNFRWGDYSMLAVDPTDDATFWYTNEYYAETSALNFRTRIGAFDLKPLPGPQIQVLPEEIDFGAIYLDESSSPTSVTISNIGEEDLIISSISDPGPYFNLTNLPTLPVTVPSFGSITFDINFAAEADGELSAIVSIASNDPDNPTIELSLQGEGIDLSKVEAIVWNPTGLSIAEEVVAQVMQGEKIKGKQITATEVKSMLERQAESTFDIAAALDANNVSNIVIPIPELPDALPPNIKYMFVVLGHFPTNFVIFDSSNEALLIENFIASGGHVYMEGGDTWAFDPFNSGHNFNSLFGIEPIADGDGGGEFMHIDGSSIAEGQNFDYNVGTDNFPDHINPTGTGFLVHTNSGDFSAFNCGIANPFGVSEITRGRTLGVSFEFGQLVNGASPSTKTSLMASYLDFFDNGFALENPQILVEPDSISFAELVGDTSEVVTVVIQNLGSEDLVISDITDPGEPFLLTDAPTLPLVISSGSSASFGISFVPTATGQVFASISITSNDTEKPVVLVNLEGEAVDLGEVEAIIWNPTGEFTGEQVIAQAARKKGRQMERQEAQALLTAQLASVDDMATALDANNVSYTIVSTSALPAIIPSSVKYMFVVLGQAPANFIIFNGTPEANIIENFIANGGHVYMEGGDVWYFDPFIGGHNFSPLFGIEAISDGEGIGELMYIEGFSIAEGQNFDYNVGTDSYPDHIDPTGTGFLVHTNTSELSTFNCGVANPFGNDQIPQGRTVGTSFEFGQLISGAPPSTKAALMASYLDFFDNGFSLEGPQILVEPDSINFTALVGNTSEVVNIIIQNLGSEDLEISDISNPGMPFMLTDVPTLPLVISSGSSVNFGVSFAPTVEGAAYANISITSNDADDPVIEIGLQGEGIAPPVPGTLFASTGTAGSKLITVNPATGMGTFIGTTGGYGFVTEIEFSEDGTLFGTTGGGSSAIIKIDVSSGTPSLSAIHTPFAINGLEFDAEGTLFGTYIQSIGGSSHLVTVNTETGAIHVIGATGLNAIGGLAFAPDGTLYGVTAGSSNGGNLITLDTKTGAATFIGSTGFGDLQALEFGPDGLLYAGIGGNDPEAGTLITIDPVTGEGTLIGNTGFSVISGLSFYPQGPEIEVVADVICQPQFYQTCQVSVDLQIDMSGSAEQLGSFSGSLSWDPSLLVYTDNSGIQSGFTGIVNTANAASGNIIFNGTNPSGTGGQIPILTVEFEVVGPLANSGMVDLEFSALTAASTFEDLLPVLGVNDCSFTIEPSPYLLGDVNGDELVNSTDATICLAYDAGVPIPEAYQARIDAGLGDVNGDMLTNSTDCLIILTYDVGLPVPYPVAEPVCPTEEIPAALAQVFTNSRIAVLGGTSSITTTANPPDSRVSFGKDIEVPVMINMSQMAEILGGYTATLSWDPSVLHFEGFTGGTSLGFANPVVNITQAEEGKLTFTNAQIQATRGPINLLQAKFKAIGQMGSYSRLDLEFDALTSGKTFYNLLPLLKADSRGVISGVTIIPEKYALDQNYPNPFNPQTEISYQLPESNQVNIGIYNMYGKKVRTLVNQEVQAGNYKVTWDGKDDKGTTLRSGSYILRMVSGDFTAERRMMFVKE